jgi:hypothetical protein
MLRAKASPKAKQRGAQETHKSKKRLTLGNFGHGFTTLYNRSHRSVAPDQGYAGLLSMTPQPVMALFDFFGYEDAGMVGSQSLGKLCAFTSGLSCKWVISALVHKTQKKTLYSATQTPAHYSKTESRSNKAWRASLEV